MGSFTQWQHLSVGSYLFGQAPRLYIQPNWVNNPLDPANVWNPWPRFGQQPAQTFQILSANGNLSPAFCQSPPNSPNAKPTAIGEVARGMRDVPQTGSGMEWKAKEYLLEEALAIPSLAQNDPSIAIARDSLTATMVAIAKATKTISRLQFFAQALDTLALLNASSLVESNQKDLLVSLIESYQTDTIGFESGQIGTFQAVAGQCPDDGGEAVYEARALLAILGFSFVEPSCEAFAKTEGQVAYTMDGALASEPTLRIVPNPSSGIVSAWVNAPAGGNIFIHDFSGRFLWTAELPRGESMVPVPAGAWADGMYVWRFLAEDGKMLSGHLTLQR